MRIGFANLDEGSRMPGQLKIVGVCLCGVAGSLLIVGLESGTFIRHVIQIVPVVIAFAAVANRRSWGPSAALPVFAWWLFVMVLIWLYLAGVRTFFTGNFTAAEIVLTMLIGLFCALGLSACARIRSTASITRRVLAVAGFGGLQFGLMWISFLPPFVNR